jgi:hypothetical protein
VQAKEIAAEIGKHSSQTATILLNTRQLTPSTVDFVMPTNSTEPTAQCVELTGMPSLAQKSTVNAVPSSTANPLQQSTAFMMKVDNH